MTVLPQAEPNTETARVLVVGQDSTVTRALSKLLALDGDIDVVGHAPSVVAAPISELRPDVVLLDTDGLPVNLPSTEAYLERVAPGTKIALLDSLLRQTLGDVLDVIKHLAPADEPARARRLQPVSPVTPLAGRHHTSALSERELEVVRLVAEGLSNKEISARLSLSDKTVKNHISHILAKMNLTARTQVAVYAIRAGLV